MFLIPWSEEISLQMSNDIFEYLWIPVDIEWLGVVSVVYGKELSKVAW